MEPMASFHAVLPPTIARRLEALGDGELVERAIEGDRWAEEALFRRHVSRVLRIATRLVGSEHEADDVVQDAFVIALDRLGDLRDVSAFGAWLTQIVVHGAHRRLRKRRLLHRLGLARGDRGLTQVASPVATPAARAELRLLDEALGRLPSRVHVAWVLRHVEGLGLAEVADACDCSLATVKRWLARADETVRRHTRRSAHG